MELEICIDSVASALAAKQGGADRIELCANLMEGGTTPSFGMIKECKAISGIELHVMIRPRGGDFCYSDAEFKIMQEDIAMSKKLGADGVVFGILTPNGNIDMIRTKKLVKLAAPMKTTFHRAFDMSIDPMTAIEDIIQCGIYRLLTSGAEQTAIKGRYLIEQLVHKAGDQLHIMAGSGINPKNVKQLVEQSGVKACHLTAKKVIPGAMNFKSPNINMGVIQGISEYDLVLADTDIVRKIREIINKF